MTEADAALSERMLDYWMDFIKTGCPSPAEPDDWRPCTGEDPFVKILNI
jgi:para-nitrobenzyl esterase